MLGSPVLDVAIGMAMVYLLLSLIASAFQEVLASLVQARSANLERGIRSLFSGDSLTTGTTLFAAIYDHGLIRGLYQDPTSDYGRDAAGNPIPEPAWTKLTRQVFGALRLALRWLLHMHPAGKDLKVDDLLLPSYIPSRTFALALCDILNNPRPFGWDSMKNMEANLTALHQKYADNKAVEALLTLVVDAAGKPEKLQTNLENWYNDSMDRVSGWYRRYVQNILLFIGLGVAIALNVDSIRVARTLWVDKDARTGLSTAASAYLNTHTTPPNSATATPPQQVNKAELQDQLKKTIGAFNDVSRDSLLPIGWKHSFDEYWAWYTPDLDHNLQVLEKLAGWMITAIALSLGAPFWFDALNKFMVVRGTIKPQEKSMTDQSKDN
jgi:hypothetical protein